MDFFEKGRVLWFQTLFREFNLCYKIRNRLLGQVYHFSLLICYPYSLIKWTISSIDQRFCLRFLAIFFPQYFENEKWFEVFFFFFCWLPKFNLFSISANHISPIFNKSTEISFITAPRLVRKNWHIWTTYHVGGHVTQVVETKGLKIFETLWWYQQVNFNI